MVISRNSIGSLNNSNISVINSPILKTKLEPSLQKIHIVNREDILRKLTKSLDNPLTLVAAPAGYGKTLVMSQLWSFLKRSQRKIVWISLAQEEKNIFNLFNYIIAGLCKAGIYVPPDTETLKYSVAQAFNLNLSNVLLNFFEYINDEIIFIFDDYHLIDCHEVRQFLVPIIQHSLKRIRFVISSRMHETNLVSLFQTNGNLMIIDEAELRFGLDEINILFNNKLNVDNASYLLSKTGGWPAVIQLAKIWMEEGRYSGDKLKLFFESALSLNSYITHEIFESLPDDIQIFLTKTSVLTYINYEIANYVCKRLDSRTLLQELLRRKLLITVIKNDEIWYQYNPLLTNYLLHQLESNSSDNLAILNKRASKWFSKKGLILDAIRHAIKIKDKKYVLDVCDKGGLVKYLFADSTFQLKNIFHEVPTDCISDKYRLNLAMSYLHMKEGDIKAAYHIFNKIKKAVNGKQVYSNRIEQASFEQEYCIIEALLHINFDDLLTDQFICKMETLVSAYAVSNTSLSNIINSLLCIAYYRRGLLLQARTVALRCIKHTDENELLCNKILLNLHIAMVDMETGDFGEALQTLCFAEEIAKNNFPDFQGLMDSINIIRSVIKYELNEIDTTGADILASLAAIKDSSRWTEIYLYALYIASSLLFLEENIQAAEHVFNLCNQIAVDKQLPRLKQAVLRQRIILHTYAGNIDIAESLSINSFILDIIKPPFTDTYIGTWDGIDSQISVARLKINTGDIDGAIKLLTPCKSSCSLYGYNRKLTQINLLLSLAYYQNDLIKNAASHMIEALLLIQSKGFRRVFIDEGKQMGVLLSRLVTHIGLSNLSPEITRVISELITSDVNELNNDKHQTLSTVLLTKRELEILDGLQRGETNKIIARQLKLSDNTVKFHLKNIYKKLGVGDRRLAIAVAESTGLLSSNDRLC